MDVQTNVLNFIDRQMQKLDSQDKIPIIMAGDIFDRWDTPLSTVNYFSMILKNWSRPIIAVAGQHDMPYHDTSIDVWRTSWWTMNSIAFAYSAYSYSHSFTHNKIRYALYPWGDDGSLFDSQISVLHKYVYKGTCTIPGIDKTHNAEAIAQSGMATKFIVCGDNHSPFLYVNEGKPTVVNCGGILQRTTTEQNQHKYMYVLYDDKTVDTIPLPLGEFLTQDEQSRVIQIEEMEEMTKLNESISLKETIMDWVKKQPIKVQKIIIESMKGRLHV